MAAAPLAGNSYAINTVQVYAFLLHSVTGNDTAEVKIQGFIGHNNGLEVFKRPVELYKGIGIHAIDIRGEADEVIKSAFFGGEKPPYMWWSQFEKRFSRGFNAYIKGEGCVVHSDSMKIRMLINKIKADFLTPTKAQLKIEQVLDFFWNMVNQKHPPQMGAAQK